MGLTLGEIFFLEDLAAAGRTPSCSWRQIVRSHHSHLQRVQEGVFTRLSQPIFGDLENYLRNVLPARSVSACLVKIEIQGSAMPDIVRELERRGINEDSLGFTGQSENPQLDEIAERCNASLPKIAPGRPAAEVDKRAVQATAMRLAEEFLAKIGSGKVRRPAAGWGRSFRRFPERRASGAAGIKTASDRPREPLREPEPARVLRAVRNPYP